MIERLAWDSRIFGLSAGRITDHDAVPSIEECRSFDHVSVKVPQQDLELMAAYEQLGFRFVTIDYALERAAGASMALAHPPTAIKRIAKDSPGFLVSGFSMAGSRLALDRQLHQRMPADFWDAMILSHCREFADFCLCAVNGKEQLEGFVSCFERKDAIDLFLVAVHPGAAGKGIGTALIGAAVQAGAASGKKLTTNVVSHNIPAMRFYFRRGFLPVGGDIVLHYSNV